MKHLSPEVKRLFEELKKHLPSFNHEFVGNTEFFYLGKGYKTFRATKIKGGAIEVFITKRSSCRN